MENDQSFVVVFGADGSGRENNDTLSISLTCRPHKGEYISVGDDTYRIKRVVHNYGRYNDTALFVRSRSDR